MKYLDFKSHFTPFRIFSINDISKWNSHFDSRRLIEWQNKGYLTKIINRWYTFSDDMPDREFLFLASSRIYSPSYISLESALSYYNLIPEGVFLITAITSLKTKNFETPIANFRFRHVKNQLIFGYDLIKTGNQHFKIASPEKLILDFFYLNSDYKNQDDFDSMRINISELKSLLDLNVLNKYLGLYNNKALEGRMRKFLKYVY